MKKTKGPTHYDLGLQKVNYTKATTLFSGNVAVSQNPISYRKLKMDDFGYLLKFYSLLKRSNVSEKFIKDFLHGHGYKTEEEFLIAFTTEPLQVVPPNTVGQQQGKSFGKEKEKIEDSTALTSTLIP